MLRTWKYGTINIVNKESITIYDSWIEDDITGEYSYYQLANGLIVAVDNWE